MIHQRFFAEDSIRDLPEFQLLTDRFGELQRIENFREFRQETAHREKQCVIFAKKRGPWLKPFHCYSQNKEYRYFSLDLAEGCAFDCVYCYLQSYLNHGAMVFFIDTDSLQDELRSAGEGMWISTGLLTDSLLAEEIYPVLPRISSLIPEGSILEMRTKSADVECLANAEILRDRIVVSWSLNPHSIAQTFEYGAAPLAARLKTAARVVQLGYRIAFHLDPVFFFDGWREEYAALIGEFTNFPANSLAFFSLGLFRYMPSLGTQIRRRFPYHPILTGEFFPDEDGKYHYLRAIRREMHEAFREWLQPWSARVPIFWSMEPDRALVGL